VKLVEPPPSCGTAPAIVFIGKNCRGNWVAQEQNGLFGGLFVNRAQAVKYALFENGHHPETIVELSREIELNMGGAPSSDHAPGASMLLRRVA
jgi:transposase